MALDTWEDYCSFVVVVVDSVGSHRNTLVDSHPHPAQRAEGLRTLLGSHRGPPESNLQKERILSAPGLHLQVLAPSPSNRSKNAA